jgi:hypothetical protein
MPNSTPRLSSRSAGLVDLLFFNSPDIQSWTVGSSLTLNSAFAGVTDLFTVQRGQTYRSPSIVRKGWGTTQTSNRGLTRATYDPEDFWAVGSTSHDDQTSYVRCRALGADGVLRPAGPILIVPPRVFFTNTRPKLTVAGTAPNVAGGSDTFPPAGSMHFVLPKFSDSMVITNADAGVDIYMAFGAGESEIMIPRGRTVHLADAAVSEVFIRGQGGTATFSIYFAIVNAEMA